MISVSLAVVDINISEIMFN